MAARGRDHPERKGLARVQHGTFDYATPKRGKWARLKDRKGHEVVLTEYPGSLVSMLEAGVLIGQAKADALLERAWLKPSTNKEMS